MTVQDVMNSSNVKFGTSGARGLAADITDFVAYVYTKGFLQHLAEKGEVITGTAVAIAGDLRPSTGRIMRAVRFAAAEMGFMPVNCGRIPSPAVAYYGIQQGIPAIMVTGSHIPADRNGIKFNKPAGEILKPDEEGIREQEVAVPTDLFDRSGSFREAAEYPWPEDSAARDLYVARYLDLFPSGCLSGLTVGIYQHTAVGLDIMERIISSLGAGTVVLGHSNTFIPVDTEAIREEDIDLARRWTDEYGFDSIISTDGDSDRPLISDEHGKWLRGDIAGILCAKYLGADSVSIPVSCNSAAERSGYFPAVRRTKIGSPYVIAAMNDASAEGAERVVGYEANGGFLTNSRIPLFGAELTPLPTRDAVIVHLAILMLSIEKGKSISELARSLPSRYTYSDRLKNFPQEKSRAILSRFTSGIEKNDLLEAANVFGDISGACSGIDRTDGIRMTFNSGEIIHLRPSGNAPEFRCYTEAETEERAREVNEACMSILKGMHPL